MPKPQYQYEVRIPHLDGFTMQYYLKNTEQINHPKIFTPHVHDTVELYILLEGDVSFTVEHSLYKLSPGDIILTKPNEMHNCILHSEGAHKHACFWFSPMSDFLFKKLLLHDLGEHNHISPPKSEKEKLIELCLTLEAASREERGALLEYSLALQLLHIVRENLAEQSASESLPSVLNKILSEIDENLAEVNSLSYLTEKYFISRSTLTRLFDRYMKVSPGIYLETKKLATARVLLKEGKSVTDACMQVGYPDVSNFIRLFRRRFGITPKQYSLSND